MAPFGAATAQDSRPPISPVTPSHHASGGSTSGRPSLTQNHPIAAASPSTVSDGTSHGPGGLSSAQHKRVYQACIPCRRRKVRCDLGSVDNPHDPPCVRCRRESKECFFSATRRKRKLDEPEEEIEQDDYIIRNGRKQLRSGSASFDRRLYSETPLTPGGSHGRSQPLRRPGSEDPKHEPGTGHDDDDDDLEEDEPNAQLENLEAQSVMRTVVYGPHDALDLLYKAATNKSVAFHALSRLSSDTDTQVPNSSSHRHNEELHQVTSSNMSTLGAQRGAGPDIQKSSSHKPEGSMGSRQLPRQGNDVDQPIDPELTKRDQEEDPGHDQALLVWARFRFVRAGWFTAQEAIEYIQ